MIKISATQRQRSAIRSIAIALAGIMIAAFILANAGRRYHLAQALEPNAGEAEALPAVVYQGIRLVRANGLQSVALSASLANDVEVFQRYGEGMYPLRMDQDSRFFLVRATESAGSTCQTLAREPLVILQRCP